MNTGTKVTTGATAITHDIELPPLPEDKIIGADNFIIGTLEVMELDDVQDYARAAIEADRKKFGRNDNDHCKRRGEPTAAEISNVVCEITGCPDIKSGDKSLVVALGMLFHSCAAPQPAEPVHETARAAGNGAGSGMNTGSQAGAHDVIPYIGCGCNSDDCRVNGCLSLRQAQSAMAPGGGGMPAEPVKGPSDSAIMFEWSQTPNTGDMRVDLIAFARALLARYG